MQNIEAILTELGIEVSADKKESLTKKVAENYVTKAEHEKKLRLTGTRGKKKLRRQKAP